MNRFEVFNCNDYKVNQIPEFKKKLESCKSDYLLIIGDNVTPAEGVLVTNQILNDPDSVPSTEVELDGSLSIIQLDPNESSEYIELFVKGNNTDYFGTDTNLVSTLYHRMIPAFKFDSKSLKVIGELPHVPKMALYKVSTLKDAMSKFPNGKITHNVYPFIFVINIMFINHLYTLYRTNKLDNACISSMNTLVYGTFDDSIKPSVVITACTKKLIDLLVHRIVMDPNDKLTVKTWFQYLDKLNAVL